MPCTGGERAPLEFPGNSWTTWSPSQHKNDRNKAPLPVRFFALPLPCICLLSETKTCKTHPLATTRCHCVSMVTPPSPISVQCCLRIVRAGRDFPAEECWCSYPKATVEEQQQKKTYPYTNGCSCHTGFLGVRSDCVSTREPTSPARWNGSESSTVVATMLDSMGAGQEIMRPNLTTKLPEKSSSTNGSGGDKWITKQLAEHRGKN